ncbi:hypothetical protein PoB_004679000 [Plakobranchus ocellatus]|uniref:Uncharacterized protein n=1 Tax=Plakobranchus ocellatus TaxID=259542 RepID=A0AAV4BLG7_9GAST|nr:hypothetical protein PoB_004679000 [Plakobranchus ocellatus]
MYRMQLEHGRDYSAAMDGAAALVSLYKGLSSSESSRAEMCCSRDEASPSVSRHTASAFADNICACSWREIKLCHVMTRHTECIQWVVRNSIVSMTQKTVVRESKFKKHYITTHQTITVRSQLKSLKQWHHDLVRNISHHGDRHKLRKQWSHKLVRTVSHHTDTCTQSSQTVAAQTGAHRLAPR